MKETAEQLTSRLLNEAKQVKGGYVYNASCSYQICFPLADGGEIRLCVTDDDVGDGLLHIDYYCGLIRPGVSGPVESTGPKLAPPSAAPGRYAPGQGE